MHGARRVIVFCLLTAILPTILLTIPLYLRHSVFADVTFAVAESDVLEINEGLSSVFCQEHSLKMNSTFNAYQVKGKPDIGPLRNHKRLTKSMNLVDDTLEYWGFYLLKGSTVNLTVCSRALGARILVVAGERNLRTCGLGQHTKAVNIPIVTRDQGEVKVTFEKSNFTNLGEKPNNVEDEDKDEEDENVALEETDNLETFKNTVKFARNYLKKQMSSINGNTDSKNWTTEERIVGRKLRHARSRAKHVTHHNTNIFNRKKRSLGTAHNLDARVAHGSSVNITIDSAQSSVSSFETSLLVCYDGNILLSESFQSSNYCSNHSILEQGVERMITTHNVLSDGYYYYIFYSDNDLVENNINAVFDIYKPTYLFNNNSKNCLNNTLCNFDINFGSDVSVIVEVPTRDGIEEGETTLYLVSTCHPRMSVYIIFPILVLFLILGCAFL